MQYTVKPDENNAELIYTAITRCKENLFILNCGNENITSSLIIFVIDKYDNSKLLI